MVKKKYARDLNITQENMRFFEHPRIEQDDIQAVLDTLKKGDISWPDGATNELETLFCKSFGVSYAVAHCNATSAMFSAFLAIGLDNQSEVICPTYTWWASISPAIFFNSKITFCDSSEKTLTPSLEDIKKVITTHTKAVVLPHLWGEIGELQEISAFCKKNNLFLIEDNSHGIGARIGKKYVGTFGDICITSLQKNKGVSGGEGGVLSTNSKELFEKSLLLGHYERLKYVSDESLKKFSTTGGGLKFRIHPLASALALSKLKVVKKQIQIENTLMNIFRKEISKIEFVKIFATPQKDFARGAGFSFRFHLDATRVGLDKSNLLQKLSKNGFPVTDEYYPLLHKQELFKKFALGKSFPVIEEIHPNLIAHPVFRRGKKSEVTEYTHNLRDKLESFQKH